MANKNAVRDLVFALGALFPEDEILRIIQKESADALSRYNDKSRSDDYMGSIQMITLLAGVLAARVATDGDESKQQDLKNRMDVDDMLNNILKNKKS